MTDLLKFFIGIGVIQGILLGMVLLIYPKENLKVPRLIGITLFLSSMLLVSELMDLFKVDYKDNLFSQISILIDLLFGPLIFWISLIILGKKSMLHTKDIFHFLPMLFGTIWWLTGFRMFGTTSPGIFSPIPDAIAVFVAYKGLVIFTYVFAITRIIITTETDKFSRNQQMQVKFLNQFIWSFMGIALVSYASFWLMFFGVNLKIDSDQLSSLLVTCFIYFITFNILRNPGLFLNLNHSPIEKYSNSKLEKSVASAYEAQIMDYMREERPYLNQKLSLVDLAGEVNLSPNLVSQVINDTMEKSFHDLVNEFRLNEIKKKLLDPKEDHKTILALALESGFQSKASFNRVFKKSENTTPIDFRQKNRSQPTF